MLLPLLLSTMAALSLSLILSSSPVSMGLWILFLALTSAALSASMFSSWFGIIIFLIYIGGMLVMFAYFSALSPNEPMSLIVNTLGFFLCTILILPTTLLLKPSNFFYSQSIPSMMKPLTTLFTPFNFIVLMFLAILLFVALVAVVKIAAINKGPLRPFAYV
uniref:NADH dehydrogenase subunit 6 n=1 Tax=Iphione sp. YZ-2018 TaxID=2153332 RepID=A0A343W6H2_9ANNE|nr:NADH dehydrogenase subunit 6 [Iphione sp. YZ-2018]